MKFEKLTDNKLNIILDIQDLKERNIDIHSFMSNSIESQNLFWDILKQAEKEVGFTTTNYNIHIEAFSTLNKNFIFTITRVNTVNLTQKKKLVYKRKTLKPRQNPLIYSFNSFNDYCNFCVFLNNINFSCLENNSLILYNSKYYLILNTNKLNLIKLKQIHTYLCKFANLCYVSRLFLNKLLEYGENIISDNAIEVGIKYLS